MLVLKPENRPSIVEVHRILKHLYHHDTLPKENIDTTSSSAEIKTDGTRVKTNFKKD
jgi:hypothetical protein